MPACQEVGQVFLACGYQPFSVVYLKRQPNGIVRRRRDILSQFLTEAVVLTTFSGITGTAQIRARIRPIRGHEPPGWHQARRGEPVKSTALVEKHRFGANKPTFHNELLYGESRPHRVVPRGRSNPGLG